MTPTRAVRLCILCLCAIAFHPHAVAADRSAATAPTRIEPTLLSRVDRTAMEHWVDSVMLTLTPDERLGQLIIPIVGAADNNLAQQKIISRDVTAYHVGGLLFSAGHLVDQASLTNMAQSLAKTPLWITLDGEWGLNMRLKDAPRFPHNMALGCISDTIICADGSTLRDSLLQAYGREVARECRAMNIQVNYAPVLDINSNPLNPVIGHRSFGDSLGTVVTSAISYGRGLEAGGVMAVGKHFPGHGDTDKDSHKTLPQLAHSARRMHDVETMPFRRFCEAGLGGIMVGHLSVPSLDPAASTPSSISRPIITGLLRDDIHFDGLTFTDGLAMEGARRIPDVGVKALLAGIDVLLDPIPLDRQWASLRAAVASGTLPQSLIDAKCRKVLRYKYATGIDSLRPLDTDSLTARVVTPAARRLARALYTASLCVLKNEVTDSLPLLPFQDLDRHSFTVINVGQPASNTFSTTLARYAPLRKYTVSPAMTPQQQSAVFAKAATADRCIIAVYDGKAATAALTTRLSAACGKPYILVFFTHPYRLPDFRQAILGASAVVLAHEDYAPAQTAAGEALFGGCAVSGRLSVTLPGLFRAGTGCAYPRIRMGEAEPEQVGLRSEVLQRIDTIVAEALAAEAFPGCQVLVAKDGYIIYNKAFGYFDYSRFHAVGTESIYDLASVSKAAATVPALMLARDRCDLRLGDKISAYVPALKGSDKRSLTIREALYHETGLRDGYPFYKIAIDTTGLRKLYSSRCDTTFCLRQDRDLYFNHNYRFLDRWVSTVADDRHPLQIADGLYLSPTFADTVMQTLLDLPLQKKGSYRYSCLNFVLLRHLIESVTRQPLDAYLHDCLFAPLGATSLCYNPHRVFDAAAADSLLVPTEDDAALRKQILCGYVHDEIAAFSGGVEGNAGLFGSAQDLAKVLQMLLDGGVYGGRRYISAETCRLFTGSKTPHSRRGLGFDKPDLRNPDRSPTARECPATTYGHTGYTGTCFWVDPDHRLIYIFLSNRVYPHRWNNTLTRGAYRTRIQSLLYQAMM